MNIEYRGVKILSAGQPTPFFGVSAEYVQVGGRWCRRETWTINGVLVDCELSGLQSLRDGILNNFSNCFGNVSIEGWGSGFVEIQSVDIDQADYIAPVPYSITMIHYPTESFESSGSYVLNPSDVTSYSENQDGTLEMTREISAKGIQINGDKDSALEAAKTFINSRKNLIERPSSRLGGAKMGSLAAYFLVSSEESFNRITGEAKLTQKYKSDLITGKNIIHRYTKTEETAVSQMETVSYSGQIDVGKPDTVSGAEDRISKAREEYQKFRQSINVPFMLSEEITEDAYIGRLTYRLSHYKNINSNNFPEIQDDFTITLREDAGSSLLSASIQGSITANYGCLSERAGKIRDMLSNISSLKYNFGTITKYFNTFQSDGKGASVNLNPQALSSGSEMDSLGESATYSASFDNRSTGGLNNCFSAEIRVKKDFGVPQRAIKESYLGGRYICQNLGHFGRETVGSEISCDGIKSKSGRIKLVQIAKSAAKSIASSTSEEYVESEEYNYAKEQKTEGASISISYNPSELGISI